MTTIDPRFTLRPALPLTCAAQKFNQLQADLVSTARMWAVDEVRAAMAHQLNDPLTALLLYLNEIKLDERRADDTQASPDSLRELVERALLETERVCDIVARMGASFDANVDPAAAIAHGTELIDLWRRNGRANGVGRAPAAPARLRPHLTPREREVLALIIQGASNKEGGYQLGISTRTFEAHRANIMEKLGAKNAADLGRLAGEVL